ncbi:MAG: adenylate/guanylate cyclase domain-containing protein [Verrucomicrobiota bacterium]
MNFSREGRSSDPGTRPPVKVRTVSFRVLLFVVILGLILASSLSTTLFGARGIATVIRKLLESQIESTLDAVTVRVESLFEPSDRLLQTFEKRIRTGALPTSDQIELARVFAEALEFEDGIKWIYFGYADGRLSGALLDHGQIVLDVSQPGSPGQEWKQPDGGGLAPFQSGAAPEPFDARERIWFHLAKEHPGIVWTRPYQYAGDQGRGLTVCKAVRSADGTLIGVVGVDFLLKDITDYLRRLEEEYHGELRVFSMQGHILVSPASPNYDPIIEMIRRRLENPDDWEKIRRKGTPLVRDFTVPGDTLIAGVRRADVPGDLDCVIAIVFSRKQAFGALENTIRMGVLTALVALAASLAVGVFVAGRIATPLKGLATAVARIGRFDLGAHPMPRSSVREIRALSDAIELMRSGLQAFSHYVPVDLVRDLVQGGAVAALGGERREVAIMFCDLAGFTAYSENTTPEEAVEILTRYFEDFGSAIDANDGVIDKFLGDGMMAVFNAPARIADPEASASRAALRGVAAMQARGSQFAVRIGLHCGECLIGNVGTQTRFTYTAIGDCVNLASRLESLNKTYGTQTVASSTFQQAAGDTEFLWRRLDRVAVAGRTAPLDIFELVGLRAEASGEALRVAENYSAALEAFLSRDFQEASRLLKQSFLAADKPSQLLLVRIEQELSSPTVTGWEGVNRFEEK